MVARGPLTHEQYVALQAAYEARIAADEAARRNEPAEPPRLDDEAIDRHARALSRAGYIGGMDAPRTR